MVRTVSKSRGNRSLKCVMDRVVAMTSPDRMKEIFKDVSPVNILHKYHQGGYMIRLPADTRR